MDYKNADWRTIELHGYTYYAQKGYRILTSLIRRNYYDFVAEFRGEFIRVNVKVATLKDKRQPNSWAVSMPSGVPCVHFSKKKKIIAENLDIYLVWVPPQERFIEIPGDFLQGTNSKSRRIPKSILRNS